MLRGHDVQFYEDAAFLGARVAGFLTEALARGGGAIALARPEHLETITRELGTRGLDFDALADEDRLVLLDAEHTLSGLLVDGGVDRDRFHAQILPLVTRLTALGDVQIYGEMVDLLWSAGNPEAMLALEQLWEDLGEHHSFGLLCGYQLSSFADVRHSAMFDAVCSHHHHVGFTESIDSTGRAIARLEQRARALDTEVAARARIERCLEELLAISGELDAARSREDVARIAVGRLIPALGAYAGGLWDLTEGRTLRLLARSTRGIRGYETIPLDGDTPLAHAVRHNEPVLLGSYAEYRERFSESYERVRPALRYQEAAFALLPVVADGAPVGGISFTYDHRRTFVPSDRTFMVLIARNCALALERVQAQALRLARG